MMSDSSKKRKLRILTVGDGDLSGSLAILRAYGPRLESLVATTLVSSIEELTDLYPDTACNIWNELQQSPIVTIMFQVDATRLHLENRILNMPPLDYILFQHPHVGMAEEKCLNGGDDEKISLIQKLPKHALLARIHSSLVAHYLFSARELLTQQKALRSNETGTGTGMTQANHIEGQIHLCLCAGQSKSWKLESSLRRLGLQYAVPPTFAAKPLWPFLEAAAPSPRTSEAEQRKITYWLSQYGYQHQPTFPSATQLSLIINSHHHFFRIRDSGGIFLHLQSSCQICQQDSCRYERI